MSKRNNNKQEGEWHYSNFSSVLMWCIVVYSKNADGVLYRWHDLILNETIHKRIYRLLYIKTKPIMFMVSRRSNLGSYQF